MFYNCTKQLENYCFTYLSNVTNYDIGCVLLQSHQL